MKQRKRIENELIYKESKSISNLLDLKKRRTNLFKSPSSKIKFDSFNSDKKKIKNLNSEKLHFSPKFRNSLTPSLFTKLNKENLYESDDIKKVKELNLTQMTRKHGPARNRNTIKMKMNLVNDYYSSRKIVSVKIPSKIEEKTNNYKIRSSLLALQNTTSPLKITTFSRSRNNSEENIANSTQLRRNITEFYNKSIETNKTDRIKNKSAYEKSDSPLFNINQELKAINSVHFFQKYNNTKKNISIIRKPQTKINTNIFYQSLMMSHKFQSKVKEKERNRLTNFFVNDWINKLLFQRKIHENCNSVIFQNKEEISNLQQKIKENILIREKFKNANNITNQELFSSVDLIDKMRKSIKLRSNTERVYAEDKFKKLDNYSKTKEYSNRDSDFQKNLKILMEINFNKNKKKKKKFKIPKNRLIVIRESILDFFNVVEKMKNLISNDQNIYHVFPNKSFHNKGSFIFLKKVKENKYDIVEKMIYENPYIVYDYDEMLQTALHIACNLKYHQIIILLIQNNARINIKDKARRTPLYYAAKNNDHRILKIFFYNQANPWSSEDCNYLALSLDKKSLIYFKKAKLFDILKKLTSYKIKTKEWINRLYSFFSR